MKYFSAKYRVYYEDTDAGGVVYYGNFLRFAERARTDMLRLSSYSQFDLKEKSGVFFVVRKVEIEYLRPGRLDDELTVNVFITKTGRTSVTMKQEFLNQNNEKLADMNVQIVSVIDDNGRVKSCKTPEDIYKFFVSYLENQV